MVTGFNNTIRELEKNESVGTHKTTPNMLSMSVFHEVHLLMILWQIIPLHFAAEYRQALLNQK
jgi:hypothetical protein